VARRVDQERRDANLLIYLEATPPCLLSAMPLSRRLCIQRYISKAYPGTATPRSKSSRFYHLPLSRLAEARAAVTGSEKYATPRRPPVIRHRPRRVGSARLAQEARRPFYRCDCSGSTALLLLDEAGATDLAGSLSEFGV
jgi:hypothetical protein